MTNGDLPQLSESQRIGLLAEKCFAANRPNSWIPKEATGTADFGIDYLIQRVVDGQVVDSFKVQLKGTENPNLIFDGQVYAIELKASTVRYYANATEPILLVVADLSASPSAKNCPLFHCWAHDELKRINFSDLPDEQKHVTLHVPKANILDEETDLAADLCHLREIAKVAGAFDLAMEKIYPEEGSSFRIGVLRQIPGALVLRGPSLIEALIADQGSIWINPPQGSMAWRLTEIDQRLKAGDSKVAAEMLASAEEHLRNAEKAEVPEYWHLRGRMLSLDGDEKGALESFARAVQYGDGKAKYLAAWAETHLRLHFDVETLGDYSDILSQLSGDDPALVETRARILGAEGKYDEAMALATTLAKPEREICQAIVHSTQGEWGKVLAVCSEGLATQDLKAGKFQLFLVLKARARFHLALADSGADLATTIIPPDGLPGTDIDLLNLAWDDIGEAVVALRSAGWPSNVEFISDIWPSVAAMLGKQAEALPFLAQAGAARPHIAGLQLAIESIAAQTSEFTIALEANARQPVDQLSRCRRVALLHGARRDSECVVAFDDSVARVDHAHPMFVEALSCAILSADRLVRSDLVDRWRALFGPSPEHNCALTIVDFFLAKANNFLGTSAAQDSLEAVYAAQGQPFQIAVQLIQLMDPTVPLQAKKAVEIGAVLQAHRMLDIDATLHIAQAYSTLGDWDSLLGISTGARRRFKGSERLAATEALALDRLGRTAEARAVLERLIHSGGNDRLALNVYISIAARCGMLDEAVVAVESVLSTSTTAKQKIQCLRLLYNLRHISNPHDPRTLDLVWRIGQLGDQSDEVEEGVFLGMILAVTDIVERPLETLQAKELNARLASFFERFPNSNVFGKAEAGGDPVDGATWSSMTRGPSRQAKGRQAQVRIENQIRLGSLRVPFAWRPRNALRMVPDLPHLWDLSKRSRNGDQRHFLVMTDSNWRPTPTESMHGRVPLMDLLSLLVAHDLGILPDIFRLFPKIAIGQGTLVEIARLTAPMAGSSFRGQCLQLQSDLREKFEQILQPFVAAPDMESSRSSRWPLKEIQSLSLSGEYLLYSDDSIFRSMCAAEAGHGEGICALDVLSALEQDGRLTSAQVAQKIAQLASWNVALAIDTKYQKAILPATLSTTKSVAGGIDVIRSDAACMAVLNAVWNGEPDCSALLQRAGSLLRDLIGDEKRSAVEVAAVMGVWFFKAKLRDGSPSPATALLAYLTFQAAGSGSSLDAPSTKRLWRVYGALVELTHGDKMDEKKENESIEMLGSIGANIDFMGQHGTSLAKEMLDVGLTEGTSDHERFHRGYSGELIRLVAQNAM